MSIDVTINQAEATFAVRPAHGKPVTFTVTERRIDVARYTGSWHTKRLAPRFVVGLKGSSGNGFGQFVSFEKACRSALWRARRYDRAYSVPRQLCAEGRAA